MTDQDLIQGLLNRDEDAYRSLVDQFQVPVYNTILGLVQSEPDAEDLAQEVFIQVFRSIHQFKGEAKLSTWIYRIATTKSIDFIRSKRSKKRFAYLYRLGAPGDKENVAIPDFHHPGVVSERKEQAAQLFQAIAQLPENQKTAFILTRMELLSHAVVAEIMGITVPAVESLLHRGRINLKKLLEKHT